MGHGTDAVQSQPCIELMEIGSSGEEPDRLALAAAEIADDAVSVQHHVEAILKLLARKALAGL